MKSLRFIVLPLLVFVGISCEKDDAPSIAPPRDFAVQYTTDAQLLEDYLANNYLTVDSNNNVTIQEIPEGGTQLSILEQQEFPLQHRIVKNDRRNSNLVDGLVADPVDYKLYYIILNEGGGVSPSAVDSVFVSYKGWRMDNVVFDQNISPIWFENNNVVSGFRQILTQLRTAESFTDNPDGTVTFSNYGNALVFVPSGLGYFNTSPANIGAYQNLVFQVNLHSLYYRDQDRDGIKSKNEIYEGNFDVWKQDSDGDNIPDFLDIDDDGDNVLTKIEIKDQNGDYYDFDLIPDCNGDVTTPNRIKKHVNPECQ
jgi:hypothetical protein